MRACLPRDGVPDHFALAYDAWAPIGDEGKIPKNNRDHWVQSLAAVQLSPDYASIYDRWKASFVREGDRLATFTLSGRLLIGHGNTSATDVGLTVHHTWGVPVIPGSALKGLLAHYVDAVYGSDDPSTAPWEQAQVEQARFQGVTWQKRRIQRGPGEMYRALFGSPDAEEDVHALKAGYPAGAMRGVVVFHDALYIPEKTEKLRPFAADVLTVHQKTYYDKSGETWPNDYDDPNPVAFITVRPGTEFLLALSGPPDWTELAGKLLSDALKEWGVGAKTSAGYGVGEVDRWRVCEKPPRRPASESLRQFLAWLQDPPSDENGSAPTQRQIVSRIEEEWGSRLQELSDPERQRAGAAIGKKIKSPKLVDQRDSLISRLTGKGE